MICGGTEGAIITIMTTNVYGGRDHATAYNCVVLMQSTTDLVSQNGETALIESCKFVGHLKAVKVLLAGKVNTEATDRIVSAVGGSSFFCVCGSWHY